MNFVVSVKYHNIFNKMKKLFFFSLTIIFISFGCADINRSKQIKNIDAMIEYLDSTSTIIHCLNPIRFQEWLITQQIMKYELKTI